MTNEEKEFFQKNIEPYDLSWLTQYLDENTMFDGKGFKDKWNWMVEVIKDKLIEGENNEQI